MKIFSAYEIRAGKKQFYHSDFHWVSLSYEFASNMYLVSWGIEGNSKSIVGRWQSSISDARKKFKDFSKFRNGIDIISPKDTFEYEVKIFVKDRFVCYLKISGYEQICEMVKSCLMLYFPNDDDISFHKNLWGFEMMQKEKGYKLKISATKISE